MAHSLIRQAAVCCAAALTSCGGRPPEYARPPVPAHDSTAVHLLVPPPAQSPETVTVVEDQQLLIDQASWRNGGHGPVLVLRTSTGLDTRDLLDGGADLLLTDEPSALAYAATLSGFRAIPLDWDRTYVLVSRSSVALDDTQRAELARNAVRVEARAAEPPYWWNDGGCPPADTTPPRALSAARIVYVQGDSVARDIAARLVAQRVGGTVALGVNREEFAAALRAGREAAYVLPLSRRPPHDCSAVLTWPAGATAVPLIDTRRRAIVRDGALGLSVDADGRLRLEFR